MLIFGKFGLFLSLWFVFVGPIFSQNQNISNGLVFDGEPYIAVNPADNQQMVVAWMGFRLNQSIVIKTKHSSDGGASWSTVVTLPHQSIGNTSADPSLQFDKNGNVFVCYIDYDAINFTNGAIYVAKSTDGGASWGMATEAISISDCPGKFCVDRPWMEIDRSNGPNQGNIYVTAMNADQNVSPPYNPYLSVSTDGGVSFSAPRLMDTTGFLAGSLISQPMPSPAVGADGTFYAVYPSFVLSQNLLPTAIMASSQNGGISLSHRVIQTVGAGAPVTNEFAKKASFFLSDESNANHLALISLGRQNGDADVFFTESFDQGINWSPLQRVNQDVLANGVLQDLIWADFNSDGDLVITWRDRRNSGDTIYEVPTEIYAAVRLKGDTSFKELVISDQTAAHDTILEGSGNDFMCVQLVGKILHAVWGDVRTNRLNIWMSKINIEDATGVTTLVNETRIIRAIPNPAQTSVRFEGAEPNEMYSLFDATGNLIRQAVYQNDMDISQLPRGLYFVSFSNTELETVRLVIE